MRRQAALALGRLGGAAKPAVPALKAVMKDHRCRAEVVQALALIDPKNNAARPAPAAPPREKTSSVRLPEDVPGLVKVVAGKDSAKRTAAIQALGRLGQNAHAAVPALREAIDSDDLPARPHAALALWKIDRQGDEAVRVLVDVLRDGGHTPARLDAARALAEMGRAAKPAIPALLEAVYAVGEGNASDRELRPHAALTLWKIDDQTDLAVQALLESARDASSPTARLRAVEGFGEIGPPARVAAPLLRRCLRDTEPAVRDAAQRSLRRMDVPPEE
jgi:HEAT repeat protein